MDIYKITQVNVSDYLQIIFRRKWLFLIPFLTVFLTTIVGSFFLPKIYRSTATILIEEKQLLTPLVKEMAVAPTIEQRLNVWKEQILSWKRLEDMCKEVGLSENIEGEEELEDLITSLQKRIIIKAVGPTIIQVSFEDENRIIAQSVVNVITKTFVEENLLGQEKEAKDAINFIKDQLKIYQKKLEDSEAALKEFKEKHLLELPGSEGSNLGKAMELQNALLQINLDLQEAQKTKQMLQRQLTGQEKIVTSKTTAINPVISQLNAKLIDLETQLSELKAKKYTEDHPLVISLSNRIEEVKERIQEESKSPISSEVTGVNPIYQEIESKLHDTEALIDSLIGRQRELQRLASIYEERARSVPAQEQELTRLTRDMGVNESIYSMLLNRLETANISQRLEQVERGTRFKVIDPARVPIYPVKPNKKMIAFLGFIIGSILGFGCVFLGEYTDHSIRSLEEAESFLEIPSLGSISKITTIEEVKSNQKRRRRRIILVTIITIIILAGVLLLFLLR